LGCVTLPRGLGSSYACGDGKNREQTEKSPQSLVLNWAYVAHWERSEGGKRIAG